MNFSKYSVHYAIKIKTACSKPSSSIQLALGHHHQNSVYEAIIIKTACISSSSSIQRAVGHHHQYNAQ
jgi:hypothetical protein